MADDTLIEILAELERGLARRDKRIEALERSVAELERRLARRASPGWPAGPDSWPWTRRRPGWPDTTCLFADGRRPEAAPTAPTTPIKEGPCPN
jgi:hypothetical protein